MENSSFDGDSASAKPSGDQKDNTSGPSEEKLQNEPSGITNDQSKDAESTPPLTSKDNDEEQESPPAYMQRYDPPDKSKMDLSLDYPEPQEEYRDLRLEPEFQQITRNRKERRSRQSLVEGPYSLRPDCPYQPPLPEPEPYPDPDIDPVPNPESESQPADDSAPTNPLTWRERFQEMQKRICSFSFQFPFHTLMLTWPLGTAAMGVVNYSVCHMNVLLPYVMMAVGLFGTLVIILRLYTLYFIFERRETPVDTDLYWMLVRVLELIVWIFFITQMIYFFRQSPSFEPEHRHYCKWKYYKINFALILLTSVVMLGWFAVHVPKVIRSCRRSRPARA